MFTGIVEELGTLKSRDDGRFNFAASAILHEAKIGDSIAASGCCLTVVEHGDDWWTADLSSETLSRTSLGSLSNGDLINFERPVRLADRLGGHLVQGHVDAVGEIVVPAPDMRVRMPNQLLRYVVEKGSITVDGVSLTIVEVFNDGFSVALIPHTMAVTTLGAAVVGSQVNLEVDVMAKYAEKLLAFALPS